MKYETQVNIVALEKMNAKSEVEIYIKHGGSRHFVDYFSIFTKF